MKHEYSAPMTPKLVLKECPFCGGSAHIEHTIADAYYVMCALCLAKSYVYTDIMAAVRAWNLRFEDVTKKYERPNRTRKTRSSKRVL